MIQANELRIGNIIGYQDSDYANSPDEIHFTGPVVSVNNVVISVGDHITGTTLVSSQEAIPIPLTPEILERLGLTHFNGAWKRPNWSAILYLKGGMVTTYDKNPWAFWIVIGGCEVVVKYLHSLQNIIFAVTGEEFTIKEITK